MEEYISRREHDEFAKRIDDEQHRQNRRIEVLEDNLQQIHSLTVSVEKMALSIENMVEEQKKQGERLETLEHVPAKNWDTLKAGILGAVATALGGGIIAAIFNFL